MILDALKWAIKNPWIALVATTVAASIAAGVLYVQKEQTLREYSAYQAKVTEEKLQAEKETRNIEHKYQQTIAQEDRIYEEGRKAGKSEADSMLSDISSELIRLRRSAATANLSASTVAPSSSHSGSGSECQLSPEFQEYLVREFQRADDAANRANRLREIYNGIREGRQVD